MRRKKLKAEKIKIKTENAVMAAVIHYPRKISEKLAILLPGYLDSKDYPHLVALAEDFQKVGYTAVRFDYRGTWESSGRLSDHTVFRQLQDVREVFDFMLKRHDYTWIVLGGHSRGGLIAMLYASQNPKISAVFGLMPPYALVRTVNQHKIKQWKQNGFHISLRDIPGKTGQKEFKMPYATMAEAERYSALEAVGRLQVPLLLVAGERDKVVCASDVKKIYKNARHFKKLVIIKNVDHDYRLKWGDIKIINKEVLKWLLTL